MPVHGHNFVIWRLALFFFFFFHFVLFLFKNFFFFIEKNLVKMSRSQGNLFSIEQNYFFFQVLGMSLGAIIMLLIALYEHDMKTLFENHQAHHHD
mgnify:CR=1 FL=1